MCKRPKIVIFDLEILTDLKAVFSNVCKLYRCIGLNANMSSIICFGYKVIGEDKKAKCINAWDYKQRWSKDVNDDYEVVKAAYEILKDADAVVTHYGTKFDLPFLQSRLLYHGFPPLPKMFHIDTWRIARYKMKLSSNRLDELAKFLKTTRKIDTGGWELWERVYRREKKACKEMDLYCKQDVDCLHEIFDKIKCLAGPMPNQGLVTEERVCPKCGSNKMHKRGIYQTQANIYQRWQCQSCKSWSRSKHPNQSNKNSLRGI